MNQMMMDFRIEEDNLIRDLLARGVERDVIAESFRMSVMEVSEIERQRELTSVSGREEISAFPHLTAKDGGSIQLTLHLTPAEFKAVSEYADAKGHLTNRKSRKQAVARAILVDYVRDFGFL